MLTQTKRRKETAMEQTDKLAEYKKFAVDRGREVEGRMVSFGEDADAAITFENEAHKAGFDVTRSPAWGNWGARPRSETPPDWFVRLAMTKPT